MGWSWFQYVHTGFPNAYAMAQALGWNRYFAFPGAGLFASANWMEQFNSWYALCAMVWFIYGWRKLNWSMRFIVMGALLLPLSNPTATAMTRYVFVAIPLFFLLGGIWQDQIRKVAALGLAFLVLQLWTFWLWMDGNPITM